MTTRQIFLDTETTGLEPRLGHRIIEVAGVEMVKSQGFSEVFGCARMALGPPLPRPVANIFGVTTFELG